MAGGAYDNPKGFWEDIEIVALNDKILAALGLQWDSLAEIDLDQLFYQPDIKKEPDLVT